MNKEQLLKELEYLRDTTHTEGAALELLTFNDEYDEEYEDTSRGPRIPRRIHHLR